MRIFLTTTALPYLINRRNSPALIIGSRAGKKTGGNALCLTGLTQLQALFTTNFLRN
jgi:hypothetical protein